MIIRDTPRTALNHIRRYSDDIYDVKFIIIGPEPNADTIRAVEYTKLYETITTIMQRFGPFHTFELYQSTIYSSDLLLIIYKEDK